MRGYVKTSYAAFAAMLVLGAAGNAYARLTPAADGSLLKHGVYLAFEGGGESVYNFPNIDLFLFDFIFPNYQFSPTGTYGQPYLRGGIGYRITDYISVELDYENIYSPIYTKIDNFGYAANAYMRGPELAVTVNKILAMGFNFYARLGIAAVKTIFYRASSAALLAAGEVPTKFFSEVNIDETNPVPILGGGVDYYFNRHVALGAVVNYMFAINNTPAALLYGGRISYTF